MQGNYQTAPGLRWSVLKAGLVSGLQLQHELANPRGDKPCFSLGRAGHVAALTPGLFDIWPRLPDEHLTPSGAVSTKQATKDYLLDMASQGIEPLGRADVETARRIAVSVARHPIAAKTLDLCPQREFAVYANDPALGAVKAQADAYNKVTGILCDLKTVGGFGTFNTRACVNAITRFDYAGQLAWYRHVFQLAGLPVTEWRIVFVSSKAPHDVIVMVLGEAWQEYGQRRMEEAVDVYMDVAAGRVVGVEPELVEPSLPSWLIDDFEGDLPDLEGIDE